MAGRNKVYKDQGTFRQKTRDDAVDAAQWTYERLVADEAKMLAQNMAGINFNETLGGLSAEDAATQRDAAAAGNTLMVGAYESARKEAVAAAEGTRVNGNAADYASWVNDVGQMNVDFATAAKTAIDQLASDLKDKEDALTTDEADAAKALAASLANKEKTSEIDSATAGAGAGNSLAPIDGNDGINATTRDNAEREKLVHNRGTYETEIRQEHSTKMQAATAPAGAMQNLQGLQNAPPPART